MQGLTSISSMRFGKFTSNVLELDPGIEGEQGKPASVRLRVKWTDPEDGQKLAPLLGKHMPISYTGGGEVEIQALADERGDLLFIGGRNNPNGFRPVDSPETARAFSDFMDNLPASNKTVLQAKAVLQKALIKLLLGKYTFFHELYGMMKEIIAPEKDPSDYSVW